MRSDLGTLRADIRAAWFSGLDTNTFDPDLVALAVLKHIPDRVTFCGSCGTAETTEQWSKTWPHEIEQLWIKAHT